MNPLYIEAIEKRLRWLRHAEQEGKNLRLKAGEAEKVVRENGIAGIKRLFDEFRTTRGILPYYKYTLEHGPTYFMDKHFCQLVDHARPLTPDALKFEVEWLHSPEGWLWLEEPFYVPPIQHALDQYHRTGDETWLHADTSMHAVGWWKLPAGIEIPDNSRYDADVGYGTTISDEGTYQFLIFKHDHKQEEFYSWSYFCLRDGQLLGERVASFEAMNHDAGEGDNYVKRPEDTTLHPLHEIRWVYTALYLMAQRLTSRVREQTDRATRRRAEKQGQNPPPFIEIVTLRRQHQERTAATINRDVDWQWQWHVRGHWRDQWYPSEGIHKPVFIEAYIKGPAEKPLKPPTVKLFAAVR